MKANARKAAFCSNAGQICRAATKGIDEARRNVVIDMAFKRVPSWRLSGSQISLFSGVQKDRNYSHEHEHEVDVFAATE